MLRKVLDEAEHIFVIGDAQIAPNLVFFDVGGVDGNDDFHVLLELLKHTDLAVRLKARQYPGGVIVVKELSAEFQIELSAELGDALLNLL